MSSKLTIEATGIETVILDLTGLGRTFTSLDKTACLRRAAHTCVCTTREVLWLDEERPGRPVLSWRHDYGGGRVTDLEVVVVDRGDHGE